jgi:hypothetical protein
VIEFDELEELQKQQTAAAVRFVSEARGARMTVLKDDGLYRHLRFDFPHASWRWCEIVTWPHTLTVTGGLGCWVFSRDEDMLAFFRPDPDRARVDAFYCSEKLLPHGREGAKRFAADRVPVYIRETVARAADEYPDLAEEVEAAFFSRYSPSLREESSAREALARFVSSEGFRFDISGWDLQEYNPWFLLSCVVLPWAVEQYDLAKVPAAR